MENDFFRDRHFEENPAATPMYEVLVGHERTDKSWKSDEMLRTEYVELTDKLIYQMTDGVIVDTESGEKEKVKPDYVVWLDKSARPVSWLTKELWPTLAADKDGNVPEMPQFRYVNIDREQWINDVDPNGTGRVDIDNVGPGIIKSLRSVFVKPEARGEELTDAIDYAPTEFDGKTILIIDEVIATGRTLDIAKKFFTKAFPEARFATAHWMGGVTSIKGATGNADLPVWYKSEEVRGRGVGNRNEALSGNSKSRAQRLGRWFLSTRFSKPDQDSLRLRRELKQLADDVRTHEVLYVPAISRDEDDIEERATRINGMSFEEWIAKRRAIFDAK